MNTKVRRSYIEVQGIDVEIVRKDIKNFYIGVHPPNGHGYALSTPLTS